MTRFLKSAVGGLSEANVGVRSIAKKLSLIFSSQVVANVCKADCGANFLACHMKDLIASMTKEDFVLLVQKTVQDALESRDRANKDEVQLMNIAEAAAFLSLAVSTLYEKTSERTIPHYKHGKKIIFKKSELLAWVESRKVTTLREIRTQAANRSLPGRSEG